MAESVEICYTPTEQNRADTFNKALIGEAFHIHL